MLEDVFTPVLPLESSYKIKQLDKDSGVVFTSDAKSDPALAWTLPDLLSTDRTYITAATFFGRKRQRRYVRQVLAIVCDFDSEPGTTQEDILDRYHAAHLPLPELVIATATEGHYQAWNIFDMPLRIRHELVAAKAYKVHEAMVKALGADPNAVGAERWVRRPSEDNIVYYDRFERTSWDTLCTWYDAQRPLPAQHSPKVKFIGTLLATPAGQRIQEPAAERGCRNEWAYGLGLCLFDAAILADDIHAKLLQWNQAIEEPLPISDIETIYRSVMSGNHHASPRVLEVLTGLSAKIKGWYKWAKPRDRRRDHLSEIREDLITDLFRMGTVTETQNAWAERLDIALRSLKLVLALLRQEGIIVANTSRGRYAQSSYTLSDAYLSSLSVAVGSDEVISYGVPRVHTANSALKGTGAPRSSCVGASAVLPGSNKVRAG